MNDNPDKVVNFTGITRLDLPADRVIANIPANMKNVVVIGYDEDGDEYFASSVADGGTVLWMMERTKIALMKVHTD